MLMPAKEVKKYLLDLHTKYLKLRNEICEIERRMIPPFRDTSNLPPFVAERTAVLFDDEFR